MPREAWAHDDLLRPLCEPLICASLCPDQSLSRLQCGQLGLCYILEPGQRFLEVLQPLRRSHAMQDQHGGQLDDRARDRQGILAGDYHRWAGGSRLLTALYRPGGLRIVLP